MLKKKNKIHEKNKVANVFIKSTLNNTIISVTNLLGNTLCWSSTGICGFKGSKKSTSFAGQMAAKDVAIKAKNYGIQQINLIFSGQADHKDAILQSFITLGFYIKSLKNQTNAPYNGCRPPKKRRL